MKTFSAGFQCRDTSGIVGYFLVRGLADGNWRITERTDDDTEPKNIIAKSDYPPACWPAFHDYVMQDLTRQEGLFKANLAAIARSVPPPGFRANKWHAQQRADEHATFAKVKRDVETILRATASKMYHAGWPVDGYTGPVYRQDEFARLYVDPPYFLERLP